MDGKKRTCPMDSNTQNQQRQEESTDAKPLRRQLVGDLPLDIILIIISRLPAKLIIACKSLSKAYNHLISDPSFSTIYQTYNSNSCSIISVTRTYFGTPNSIDLVEFDKRDIYSEKGVHEIGKVSIFDLDRFTVGSCSFFSEYCNGLLVLCLLKAHLGKHDLFVINPILGEFIQLPDPVASHYTQCFAFGIGYCQLTNRYKVLRIRTISIFGHGNYSYKNKNEIFTIGSDQVWRSVLDVNVPYNIRPGLVSPHPQKHMVAFRSALHWVVEPVRMTYVPKDIKPNWGGTQYICAFDMTAEKVSAIPLPPEDALHPGVLGAPTVLLDKLCMWRLWVLWVMDEYGDETSWTKQFVFSNSMLPMDGGYFAWTPLIISPEGVMVLKDYGKLIIIDMKKNECSRVVHLYEQNTYSIHFVPCFVSLRI